MTAPSWCMEILSLTIKLTKCHEVLPILPVAPRLPYATPMISPKISRLGPATCSPPDWDAVKWRQLKAGERVEKGDWVDMARDGWRDDPKWIPASNIGEAAPDPAYPSHRIFRRVLEANA